MRALLLVLDGVGIGAAPDAAEYGDAGANTLGHLLERVPGLRLPTLDDLGLGRLLGRPEAPEPRACFGRMRERSAGKDSITGHWEIAGVVLDRPFAVYPSFPHELVEAIEREAGVSFLGNRPASGTEILRELGEEHLRTRRPILYTSADSVLQIAAHERVFPLERLYALCQVARRHADAYRIARVIARPFEGEPGAFVRTPRRRDFAMSPPRTVLDALSEAGWPVCAVGKVADLFAGRGIARHVPAASNAEAMRGVETVWREGAGGLVLATLVDFDTLYGHRRDPAGFAAALRALDDWLGGFLPGRRQDDLILLTADHGNDPTFHGTDHTREEVPLLVLHRGRTGDLGLRPTFADVAASLAVFFRLPGGWPTGTSFLESG